MELKERGKDREKTGLFRGIQNESAVWQEVAVTADLVVVFWQPSCGGLSEIVACPMNLAPVCATDGNTYANECALCVQRLETRADILIVKEESC